MSYSEKYQQLESQIEALQKEIERLKEKEKEEGGSLPKHFSIDVVKEILNSGDGEGNLDVTYLDDAFTWKDTKQGGAHWSDIYYGRQPICEKDIIQLQKWVIMYLEQNQE